METAEPEWMKNKMRALHAHNGEMNAAIHSQLWHDVEL